MDEADMDAGNEPTTDATDDASPEVAPDPSPYVVVGSDTPPARRSPWMSVAVAGAVLIVGLIAGGRKALQTASLSQT